jgi:hypothetical protein
MTAKVAANANKPEKKTRKYRLLPHAQGRKQAIEGVLFEGSAVVETDEDLTSWVGLLLAEVESAPAPAPKPAPAPAPAPEPAPAEVKEESSDEAPKKRRKKVSKKVPKRDDGEE